MTTKSTTLTSTGSGELAVKVERIKKALAPLGCTVTHDRIKFRDSLWKHETTVTIDKPRGITWEAVMQAASQTDMFTSYSTQDAVLPTWCNSNVIIFK